MSNQQATQTDNWFAVEEATLRASLFTIGAVCLAVMALYLVVVPPATGFETSLIAQYPLPFWFAFGTAFAAAVVLLVRSATTRDGPDLRGYLLLAGAYLMLYALPIVRGYQLHSRGPSDLLYHLGVVKGIIATGFVPEGLWYPLEHVLATELFFGGTSLQVVTLLIPLSLTALFVLSVGLAIQFLVGSRRGFAVGVAAGAPLLFGAYHVSLSPNLLSFLWFPLVVILLIVYRQTNSVPHLALLTLLTLTTVYFHPMTTVLLLILFASTTAFDYLHGWATGATVSKVPLFLLFVLGTAMFAWYNQFGMFVWAIREIATTLVGSHATPATAEVAEASSAPLTLTQLAIRFIQLYGAVFIYLVIGGLFALVLLYRTYQRRESYRKAYISLQFGVGFFIAVAFMNVYVIAFSPIRISRYMIAVAVILVGLLLYRVAVERHRTLFTVVLVCCVITAGLLATGKVYNPNMHMTEAEYQGSEHLLQYHDKTHRIHALDTSGNMESYVLGENEPIVERDIFDPNFPRRIGYTENGYARETFGRTYLATKEYDRQLYKSPYFFEHQRQTVFVYDMNDLARLSRDSTAAKIYENGGFEGWYINRNPPEYGQ